MALIDWNESLEIGIEEIDDQHKRLVDMINELHEGMLNQKGNEALAHVLGELVDYTATHFRFEERLFDKFGYTATAGHKVLHKQFEDQLADIRAKFESGTPLLGMEVQSLLRDWLQLHITGEDRKYVACFNENGMGVKV